MELKEILSHAEAVQFLLYSIQHGKQTRTALKKALPVCPKAGARRRASANRPDKKGRNRERQKVRNL